jgi:hypothetical protein
MKQIALLILLMLAGPALAQFNPSRQVLISGAGGIAGDPQVIRDGDHFLMFIFRFDGHVVSTSYLTAKNLRGPWSDERKIIDGYHKFRILVDAGGQPVKVGGVYHGYAASWQDSRDKEIFHLTAPAIRGPWTNRGKVVPVGLRTEPDGLYTDAPNALYANHQVFLYYMAHPAIPQAQFGLAQRVMLAIARDPNGAYLKQGAVMLPSSGSGWDHGYIGGTQVLGAPGHYVMYYNGGAIQPDQAGWETASMFGTATATNPRGPWKRSKLALARYEPGSIEKANIWRPYAFGGLVFYNTGVSGHESITYATLDRAALVATRR